MAPLSESPTGFHLFGDYQPPSEVYDELYADSGELRPAWQAFVGSLNELGVQNLSRRWHQAQRLIHEHGIAYSAYGDPEDKPRPWTLDGLPLLLDEAEWDVVAEGLRQRARLLERVLADLFGAQRLIQEGSLPPEIIYQHPGFHRAYHDQPARGGFLQTYAADLARAPDGKWWLLNDRTEAPSGVGFALENRIVISRMFPETFRRSQVHRLASYFRELRETLQSLSPQAKEDPRIVILSQGTDSENYFEDAYLARYLGFTLVQAADLAVRNDQVMLKTLGGLQRVDVIFRRPNSEACDPLELDAHSPVGVAGLLQAVRNGNVTVANALGAGLVESPIFMAFMPSLCRKVLGEELILPGIATWWCGATHCLNFVLKNLDQLIIKNAFRRRGGERAETRQLNELPHEQLIARIQQNPAAFVGQQRVARSTVPLWRGDSTKTTYVALRAYLVAKKEVASTEVIANRSYCVMSGGLSRTSERLKPLEASILAGEGSKDTWILSKSPVDQVSLLRPQGESVELRRSGDDLPSRVCDNIYWLGRHIERADSAARLLRIVAFRLSGESVPSSLSELPPLLRTLADQGQIEPGFAVAGIKDRLPAIEQALPMTVFDQQHIGSLRRVLDETIRIASHVRDRMSMDCWRILVRLDQGLRPPTRGVYDLTDLLNLTNELIFDLSAFAGMVTDSMTRTPVFRFLNIGRRLERSLQILSLLKNCFVGNRETKGELLDAVLEICDSLMTYRSRYLARLQLAPVLDLLLTDESNPRSLAYQILSLADNVERLPRDESHPTYTTDQRLAMSMSHAVRMIDIQEMCELHTLGDHSRLEGLISDLEMQLCQLSNAVSHRYLIHAQPAQQLAEIEPQDEVRE